MMAVAFCVLILCAIYQVIHGFLQYMHCTMNSRMLALAYEAAALVHIFILAILALDAWRASPTVLVDLSNPVFYSKPYLWINVVVAAISAYTALAGLETDDDLSNDYRWMPALETIAALFCTPPVVDLMGNTWTIIFFLNAFYFAIRTILISGTDSSHRRNIVSPLSIVETVRIFPEGMAYYDDNGRTLITNDAIRESLSSLKIPGNTNVNKLWPQLAELSSQGQWKVDLVDSGLFANASLAPIGLSPDKVLLFSFESAEPGSEHVVPAARSLGSSRTRLLEAKRIMGRMPSSRIIAYDVSYSVDLVRDMDQTHTELAETQAELIRSIEAVQQAAENEALIRMRSRVHDVIGQRLSMLHMLLETETLTDEALEQVKPLLNNILEDLSADVRANAQEELQATIRAFELTNTTINVNGALPEDESRATLFANCIREAATNAVKHSRATVVDVTLGPNLLVVVNEGKIPDGPIVEGTGLSHMREIVEAENGELLLEKDSTMFKLTVRFDESD